MFNVPALHTHESYIILKQIYSTFHWCLLYLQILAATSSKSDFCKPTVSRPKKFSESLSLCICHIQWKISNWNVQKMIVHYCIVNYRHPASISRWDKHSQHCYIWHIQYGGHVYQFYVSCAITISLFLITIKVLCLYPCILVLYTYIPYIILKHIHSTFSQYLLYSQIMAKTYSKPYFY